MEATEINNHQLMGTICGIIGHMFSSGICQLPEDGEEMVELPKWMEGERVSFESIKMILSEFFVGIMNLLLNPKTHKNIKIFWVKVIDNMEHVFRFFARYFVEPLLQFLNDKIAGSTMNYFVTDVVSNITTSDIR